MFLYALRAPESKRQYPKRLKVVLDYLKSKAELRTDVLEYQCREFIMKTRENPKWASNQLMQFVLFQKERVERGEIVSTTIRNYIKAVKLFLEMNFDVPLVNWKRITKCLPAPKNASNDRAPSLAELKTLMAYPDRRIRPIILCMISGAFRIGAWDYLRWKHVTPIKSEKTGRDIVKPGTDVLNTLKGSKGLQATSPSVTTDNTKVPKNFTSKASELTKDGASLERNNNLPPEDGNNTAQ